METRATPEVRTRKLELPLFDGDNPDGWIYRAERYFAMLQFTEAKKITATGICMEGKALTWFQ